MTKGDDSTIDSSSDKTINSMNDEPLGVVMGTAGNSANFTRFNVRLVRY